MFDTPIGVGGKIDTNTGQILTGALAGTKAIDTTATTPTSVPPVGTIPVSTLTNPAPAPAKVTQPAASTGMAGVQGAVNASQDAFTQNLSDNTAKAQANLAPAKDEFYKALLGQTTTGAETDKAYAATVDPAEKALKEINQQITAEQVATRHQIEDLQTNNPQGLFGTGLQQEIGKIQDASTRRQADMAVIQLSRQGQYDSAKAIADRAVSALMEAQKNHLDALQVMYEDNKQDFTKAEQRQFESAQADRNRKLEMDSYKEKARFDQVIKQNDPLYQAQLTKARQDISAGNITLNDGKYAGVAQTIIASGKFTKEQSAQIIAGINHGEDPATVIRNQAKNIMGQTEATKLSSYEAADSAMLDLQSKLASYYAGGGDTGILSGNFEKAINNLGNVKDPAKVELATQVAISLQAYRNAISGTAYSNQEGKDIASVFPGINKSSGLNTAIINGRLAADKSITDGIYSTALGKSTYQSVIEDSGGKGSKSSKDYVEKTLNNAGVSYDQVIKQVAAAHPGQIAAIDNNTGQVVAIYPMEYNATTYTKL